MMLIKAITICILAGLVGQGSADSNTTTNTTITTTAAPVTTTTKLNTTSTMQKTATTKMPNTTSTMQKTPTTTKMPNTTSTMQKTTTTTKAATTTTNNIINATTTQTTPAPTTSTVATGEASNATTTTTGAAGDTTTTTKVAVDTTTTTIVAPATFSGTVSFKADNLNSSQVETAAKPAIASHFGVEVDAVTNLTVTKSRRLVQAALRKLASTWSVAFTLSVAQSKVASITNIAAATVANKTAFASVLKEELIAAGVSAADANALEVQGFEAVQDSNSTSTTKFAEMITGGSSLPATAFLYAILIATIALTLMM